MWTDLAFTKCPIMVYGRWTNVADGSHTNSLLNMFTSQLNNTKSFGSQAVVIPQLTNVILKCRKDWMSCGSCQPSQLHILFFNARMCVQFSACACCGFERCCKNELLMLICIIITSSGFDMTSVDNRYPWLKMNRINWCLFRSRIAICNVLLSMIGR